MMKMTTILQDNLDLYTTIETDTDFSKYRVKRANVYCYKQHDTQLNAIFKRFESNLTPSLYIIGNYLYFTLDGAKYYTILSCWVDEWEHIDQLIKELNKIDRIKDIAYEYGRLD